MTKKQAARKRDMDGSVTGEVDCDALNESQISATYCIFSVRYKSVLSSLSAGEGRHFFKLRVREATGNILVLFFLEGKLQPCHGAKNPHNSKQLSGCTAGISIFHYDCYNQVVLMFFTF